MGLNLAVGYSFIKKLNFVTLTWSTDVSTFVFGHCLVYLLPFHKLCLLFFMQIVGALITLTVLLLLAVQQTALTNDYLDLETGKEGAQRLTDG